MAVWRLQANTDRGNIVDYCIQNSVAAMGWSLHDVPKTDRSSIKTFDDFCRYAKTQYAPNSFNSVYRLAEDVREGDLIWIRSKDLGKYYVARVTKDSHWQFNEDAEMMDASNQLTNMKWYPATENADEDSVPGAVATAFIMGSTFQRIKKTGIEAYSQLLWNGIHDQNADPFNFSDPDLSLNEKDFYNLLQPEDVEDLLTLWLYDRKGYVCIPSTNKIATPKYECVLIDPKDPKGKHIYIQVKKGTVDLNTDEFAGLNGEVYLLTTEGKVFNPDKHGNVIGMSPEEIYNFAVDPDKTNLIPENVRYWVRFLTEVENRKWSGHKGIMFDTNLSYSDQNEEQMLSENKIAAYGEAARYIDRFNKGDYALFYSRGRGIIAIGKIISDKPSVIGEEKNHKVKMILPQHFEGDATALPALTPQEIKTILGKNFYWASTIKTPYLSGDQVDLLVKALSQKYSDVM